MKNLDANLWRDNTPSSFWRCQPNPPQEVWAEAIKRAIPILELPGDVVEITSALEFTLGEARFGPKRYHLGLTRRAYYLLKPLIPRAFTRPIRYLQTSVKKNNPSLYWPVEPRYVQFQWEILRQVLLLSGKDEILFKNFWPEGKKFACVLTHDVETGEGQRLIPKLADLEESLGFRSQFNIVPERYPLDYGLMEDLHQRGFEIGVHGLNHDGKWFNSFETFKQHTLRINEYMTKFQAFGFRSPLTHRNPAWMQMLAVDYDQSFFDTDPYEPMPGGVMSIWPFTIGHFLELPYTLPQDYTLFNVMGETSPRVWFEKVDFLEKYHGMALVIVHPDYSSTGKAYQIYEAFLHGMKAREGCWHALPRDVASWWKGRALNNGSATANNDNYSKAALNGDGISINVIAAT